MSDLRERMIRDLKLAGLDEGTQRAYLPAAPVVSRRRIQMALDPAVLTWFFFGISVERPLRIAMMEA